MGAVYEVVHLGTHRRRALKVMLPSVVASAEMRERFKLEATIAADIESDHIVETFDAGVDPETGAPFLVMELLRGDTDRPRPPRPSPGERDGPNSRLRRAKALDKTHAAGIVLTGRPQAFDNLFLTLRDDDLSTPQDPGLRHSPRSSRQATQARRRAPSAPRFYMPPEQIKGEAARRGDGLYALGHIAYHLLVGEAYWAEDPRAHLGAIYPLLLRVAQGPTAGPAASAHLAYGGGFQRKRAFSVAALVGVFAIAACTDILGNLSVGVWAARGQVAPLYEAASGRRDGGRSPPTPQLLPAAGEGRAHLSVIGKRMGAWIRIPPSNREWLCVRRRWILAEPRVPPSPAAGGRGRVGLGARPSSPAATS